MTNLDMAECPLRELNATLQSAASPESGEFAVHNPRGAHALAVGLNAPLTVQIHGSTGYFCAGMNKHATVLVHGSAGPGVAENMMSGRVVVDGDASQYAGATGRGGTLVIHGNASLRCGISMKGIDIIVHGHVGHMSAFMEAEGQPGRVRGCRRCAGRQPL